MTMPVDKAEYKAPVLTVFGSVRNLTGGSVGRNRDGVAGQFDRGPGSGR